MSRRVLDPDVTNVKSKNAAHKWLFPTRIRLRAFSWKSSRLAVQRIKETVAEIADLERSAAEPDGSTCHAA